MIAVSGLKQILRSQQELKPGAILKALNAFMKTSLKQDKETSASDDGLEGAICLIQKDKNQVIYAGARFPLLYIDEGEVKEVKGNRQSLGYRRCDVDFEFTDHPIPLKQGQSFYLFSDGFVDQMGGERRVPFGRKRFKRILTEEANQNMQTQRDILRKAFYDHMQGNRRLDDVTLLGFRV